MNYRVNQGRTVWTNGRSYSEGEILTELDLTPEVLEVLVSTKSIIADDLQKAIETKEKRK